LAAGLRPDPLGELKRSRRPPNRNKGPTSKRRGNGGEGRRKKWKRGERRDGSRREGSRRGKGRKGLVPHT